MVSDFLVQHTTGPFFRLSKTEYESALAKYPHLDGELSVTMLLFRSSFEYQLIRMVLDDTDLNYVEGSATASIDIGKDAYFDNMTILKQFERFFQLLQFKQAYKDHTIECIVDNAKTHTAKSHSVFDFGKSIGTRCPVNQIEYKDSTGNSKVLHCYFQSGSNQGKSKGLLEIAKELQLKLAPTIKLQDLQKLLADHPAFKNVRH